MSDKELKAFLRGIKAGKEELVAFLEKWFEKYSKQVWDLGNAEQVKTMELIKEDLLVAVSKEVGKR